MAEKSSVFSMGEGVSRTEKVIADKQRRNFFNRRTLTRIFITKDGNEEVV